MGWGGGRKKNPESECRMNLSQKAMLRLHSRMPMFAIGSYLLIHMIFCLRT